ncbi:hypothetical protein GQ600_5781 [Phytophthora cactorum]|nr:hypothetical protein GQ600_5781 [Phytophthora cactorum]
MQSQSKEFDYMPHPGVTRGFFGWDFRFRGQSVSEQATRITEDGSNHCVVAALEVLSLRVNEMYTSLVAECQTGSVLSS